MIDSIEIKNFKNLDGLRIPSFARVNLITGKNNTGKSSLLEAIALYVTKCDLEIIFQILDYRGEKIDKSSKNQNLNEIYVNALASLFKNRIIGFEKSDTIIFQTKIIEIEKKNELNVRENMVSLNFKKFKYEYNYNNDNSLIENIRIIDENDKIIYDFIIGLEISIGNTSSLFSLEKEIPLRIGHKLFGNNENFQFINQSYANSDNNGKLWDKIALTEKEKYVIETLKIIEPIIEKIAFIEDGRVVRSPVAKLSNKNDVIPLRSMGDGINRILTIILALVNSENGYLLIDEFENGLHYSVQEKIWEIIFYLSNRLNVQVFATSHSLDSIHSFSDVLNNPENDWNGKLIRLENKNGVIKPVEYEKEDLRIITEHNIEAR